jgi:drug/metabolite transporter (DMT)-like permease
MSGSITWALVFGAIAMAGNLLVMFARDGDKTLPVRIRENAFALVTGVLFAATIGAVVGYDGATR